MKRLIVWCIVIVVVIVPAALVLAIAFSFQDQPTIARIAELSPEQIARAKRILKANDPRSAPAGALRTFSLPGEDLDLALNYLLSQHGGGAKVTLKPGTILLWASLKPVANPFGAYINVEAIAQQTSTLPAFDRLQVGRVPVPAFIANWVLAAALGRLNATEVGKSAADSLKSVRIAENHLVVEYEWREDLPERLRSALLPQAEQERLRIYHDRLVELTSNPKLARQVSLADLLRPLITLSATRSANADAAAENRAALITLAFYVNGRGLTALVPGAKDWPRAVPRKVTLAGRTDFSQHFTISAAIAATAGSPLADAIGVYKEAEDARGGSGFSFADIAADRAGTVFGQHATRTVNAARTLQNRVNAGIVEPDFMPRAEDLPEGLQEAEFKRRFGGVGAPPYARMLAEIERRIATLALYR
jgi:uncharacterized protein YfiM (DUF2279 family)